LSLADRILIHVKQNSERSALVSSELPFKVPENYFASLSTEILKKVKQQDSANNEIENELAEIAPLLNTISKKQVYTVPQGYFENLEARKESKAKIVMLSKTSRFIRYAAAAVITGLVALGGIFYANNENNNTTASSNKSFNPQEVNKLSEDEIVDYLKSDPALSDVTIGSYEQQNQLIKYTKELTDKEILEFLKEEGETHEIDNQEG
jgi:hypothetical protein